MAREVVITTVITVVQRVPLDEAHYPGMTEPEAVENERDMATEERVECFMMALEQVDPDNVKVAVTVQDTVPALPAEPAKLECTGANDGSCPKHHGVSVRTNRAHWSPEEHAEYAAMYD